MNSMHKFKKYKLAEIAAPYRGLIDGPFGSNLPASDYVAVGIPVIRGVNLSLGERKFYDDSFIYVSDETAKRLERSKCVKGDIIFTKKGTLGQIGIIPINSKFEEYILSSNQMKLTVNEKIADRNFVYYFLSSKKSIEKIRRESESTGVPKINLGYLKSYEILLPDLNTQTCIAKILSSLDDKIELNRQMTQTLEQMAQVLYKKYFVDDIDPDNLPNGWSIKTIEEISLKVGMGPFGANIKVETFTSSGMPIISGQNLNSTILEDKQYNYISLEHSEKLKNSIVFRGDIIFTHAGNIGQVSIIPQSSRYSNYILSQRQFYMRPNPEIISGYYIALFFRSIDGQYKLLSHASSTGVPSISQPVTNLKRIPIIVPEKSVMNKFHETIKSLYDLAAHNNKETEKLKNIRDTLLPKLMSGELDVFTINQNELLHEPVLS